MFGIEGPLDQIALFCLKSDDSMLRNFAAGVYGVYEEQPECQGEPYHVGETLAEKIKERQACNPFFVGGLPDLSGLGGYGPIHQEPPQPADLEEARVRRGKLVLESAFSSDVSREDALCQLKEMLKLSESPVLQELANDLSLRESGIKE